MFSVNDHAILLTACTNKRGFEIVSYSQAVWKSIPKSFISGLLQLLLRDLRCSFLFMLLELAHELFFEPSLPQPGIFFVKQPKESNAKCETQG